MYTFMDTIEITLYLHSTLYQNSSLPGQNSRHVGRRHFQMQFLNENDKIQIEISPKLVPKSPIDNKPALVQEMA